MSELLRFRVIDVLGATTRIHALTIHPDQYDISDAKNFALQIIVEAYWTMREGHLAGNQLRSGGTRRRMHPRRRELDKLVDMMFGAEIEIAEADFEELRASHAKRTAEGIATIIGRTVDGRLRYFKSRGPAYRAFIREADRIVDGVYLQEERNNPRDEAGDPAAEAIVVITVGDSGTAISPRARRSTGTPRVYDFHGWEDHDKTELGLLN